MEKVMLTKIGYLILAVLIWEGCKHAIEPESLTASNEEDASKSTVEENTTTKIINQIVEYQNVYTSLRKKFSSTETDECFEWTFQGSDNRDRKWVSITSVGKNQAALQDTTDKLCTQILNLIGIEGYNCITRDYGNAAVKCPKSQDGEMEIKIGSSGFQPIQMKFPIGSDSKLFD